MVTSTRLTLEEFLKLPETEPASEYVCGEVIEKGMGSRAHAIIEMLLGIVVGRFVLDHNLGEAGSEWRCVFGPNTRGRGYIPDFVFIAASRLPPPDTPDGPFFGAPDLAVEILSPNDRVGRTMGKIWFYLRHGVRLVWLIDPEERSITVFAPDEDDRTLTEEDIIDGGDVLPGFSTPVSALFPPRA
jgi:Uma2 family endonuclease